MKTIKQAVIAALLAAAVSPAFASPIVLDHSPQALGTQIYTDSFSNWYGSQYFAQGFSLANATMVNGIDMYSGMWFGQVGSKVKVSIWGDNGGVPSAMLAQFSVAVTAADTSGAIGNNTRKHADFDGFAAQAGATYWIGMAGDGTELAQSAMYNNGNLGMRQIYNGTSYLIGDFQMPFRLYGEVQSAADVPEPASLALFGLGMAGLASLRRKRQA